MHFARKLSQDGPHLTPAIQRDEILQRRFLDFSSAPKSVYFIFNIYTFRCLKFGYMGLSGSGTLKLSVGVLNLLVL